PPRLFPPEDGGQQDHEDRGGKLQDDGVGGGGQLVGQGEEHVGAAYAHSPQGDPPVEAEAVAAEEQVVPYHQQGDHVPGAVDAHAVPGDNLHTQPPDAVQHGGEKDKE